MLSNNTTCSGWLKNKTCVTVFEGGCFVERQSSRGEWESRDTHVLHLCRGREDDRAVGAGVAATAPLRLCLYRGALLAHQRLHRMLQGRERKDRATRESKKQWGDTHTHSAHTTQGHNLWLLRGRKVVSHDFRGVKYCFQWLLGIKCYFPWPLGSKMLFRMKLFISLTF